VVGYASNDGTYSHAFLYDGTMHDLGVVAGFVSSFGYGINASAEIVGAASNGVTSHAFLDYQGRMVDLNSLVGNLGGWTLESAVAINDSGSIVGYGTLNGGTANEAFLLTPVPEPSTFVLLLLGAIGLGLYGWRRAVRRA
jgi:probable HAF family extracellular repeat protein